MIFIDNEVIEQSYTVLRLKSYDELIMSNNDGYDDEGSEISVRINRIERINNWIESWGRISIETEEEQY